MDWRFCPECGDEWEDMDSENGVDYYSCPNGHVWSDDEDEDTDEHEAFKWTADGSETLEEAAIRFRGLSDALQKLHEEGYVLRAPVDNGQCSYYKPGGAS